VTILHTTRPTQTGLVFSDVLIRFIIHFVKETFNMFPQMAHCHCFRNVISSTLVNILIKYINVTQWNIMQPDTMYSSAAVNHDHLLRFMVKINPVDKGYIVMWQADLVNTKESLLPVCDKLHHNIKEKLSHWEELVILWNYAYNTCMWPRKCSLYTCSCTVLWTRIKCMDTL